MGKTYRRKSAEYLDADYKFPARQQNLMHRDGVNLNCGTKMDHSFNAKWDVTGPGGKNCACCTKMLPRDMKRPRRQAIRRHDKQELKKGYTNGKADT